MTRQVAHDVLRRMASPPPPAPEDVPITSSRAIRLAITRAADKAHNFALSVSSLREEVLTLDALLAAFEPELMLVGMSTAGGPVTGIAALDLNMRAAVLELQTVGDVLPDAPEDRPPTGTDARMAEPLIAGFLAHLQDTATRTALDGWGAGFGVGDKIASTRAAGLILEDGKYRLIRLSLDLGVGDRLAELSIALPCTSDAEVKVVKPEVTGDWDTRFRAVVQASPAQLDAELHRFKLPLHQAEGLAVGQIVPLPGCTVSSVRLLAGDGRKVATARLGQSGGMRAVRVEAAPQIAMQDMNQIGRAEVPSLSDSAMADPMLDMGISDEMMENEPLSTAVDIDMSLATPMQMDDPAADDAAAAPLSWDDEDLEAEPAAEVAPSLSWEDEGMETPE